MRKDRAGTIAVRLDRQTLGSPGHLKAARSLGQLLGIKAVQFLNQGRRAGPTRPALDGRISFSLARANIPNAASASAKLAASWRSRVGVASVPADLPDHPHVRRASAYGDFDAVPLHDLFGFFLAGRGAGMPR